MSGLVLPMGHIVSPRALGAPAPAEEWTRPADWLTLPTLVDGNQRVVGLFAVFNHQSNFVAFRCRGAYTVDWGDGTAPENVADNVTAEHAYDYAAISAATECTRGYRQVIISITPQAGQNLTSVDFNYTHSTSVKKATWLDVAAAGANITLLRFGTTTAGWAPLMERFRFIGAVSASWTSMSAMFGYCYSLQVVELSSTANVTAMSSMFTDNYSRQTGPALSMGNVTDIGSMFRRNYSLRSVPLYDFTKAHTASYVFDGCASLQMLPAFNTPAFSDCYFMLSGCRSLQSIGAWDMSNVWRMTGMFNACPSLSAAPLQGTHITHSFANCSLSREALVAIFTGLATVVGQTITISGNWGVASLTAADRLIATNKGWTIAE